MGRRGPQSRRDKPVVWSPEVAYGVGLVATDGCLSKDGRHIDLTSKDVEQLENFKKCFDLSAPISYKVSGYTGKQTPHVQVSDVVLYKFLQGTGLTPAKTKTIAALIIPEEYFFDFLRGHHDGDGFFFSYWDRRWRSSFMFYLNFTSASKAHIDWLQKNLKDLVNVTGKINEGKGCYRLQFAKNESLKVLDKMYSSNNCICLKRKRLKIEKALSIVGKRLASAGAEI